MIDWLQKPSTIVWGLYLAAAELSSCLPSYSFTCILISDENDAKDYSGNQTCAPVHEAIFRFSKFIWVNANHDNISAFAAIAVAVFTFTLWRSTLKLWETGKKQIAVANAGIKIAKNAYVAEHRTWLKIYPTEIGPVTFDGDRIRVNITVEAKNIGGSPAVAVNLCCKPYRGRGFVVLGNAVESLIAEEKAFASLTKSGMILMTGDKHNCMFSADAETDATTEAKTKEQEALGIQTANLQVTLSIACCVIYKSLTSDDWHHTGHMISLRKKDRSRFDAALGDVTGDNIKVTMDQSASRVV
ncbi:MAG: hypothetical protein WBW81_16820 [Methylocella sp.]